MPPFAAAFRSSRTWLRLATDIRSLLRQQQPPVYSLFGMTRFLIPRSRAATATGSTPKTALTPSSSPSSPTSRNSVRPLKFERSRNRRGCGWPSADRIPSPLFYIRRREVDGDVCRRHVKSGILDGRTHAVAALANRCIGQAHGMKVKSFSVLIPERSTSTSMMFASMPLSAALRPLNSMNFEFRV